MSSERVCLLLVSMASICLYSTFTSRGRKMYGRFARCGCFIGARELGAASETSHSNKVRLKGCGLLLAQSTMLYGSVFETAGIRGSNPKLYFYYVCGFY